MSDTARTDEIDEVMSSVKKLVTQSDKDAAKPSIDAETNKFVLTQSLRVAVPDEEGAPTEADEKILVLDASNRADRAGLEATIAELEAAVTAQPDEWEPDEGETFENTAWAASAFQAPRTPALEEPEQSEEPEQLEQVEDTDQPTQPENMLVEDVEVKDDLLADADDDLAVFFKGENAIDEEMLRDLVVQMLREELRGEMGERITRNVRKLVRREINRVLASRDLT